MVNHSVLQNRCLHTTNIALIFATNNTVFILQQLYFS